ncbi:hypothetical protein PGT21_034812 [Puccinia graminis f. sp. tritici]|uniref:Uncharacterized protein n=1 Tax=Puccinia graminis f. sp. tritici TaxID=56615 RepID=A0A5B0RIY5_PUCGR|nr:hypothetical protein PGT21_034812 [Puccinia graminis f. sp. tritici]KAA1125339.1 hypothetical protein PGTUg99_008334 [Puccinia graminis f. sp. tritici]
MKNIHRSNMPLPIETPAPKASSIIKRFQQTIDNLDGQPALPLPKPRLSRDPEEIAQNRRSWSVGSGGAPLSVSQVTWTPPASSLLSKSSGTARSETDQVNHHQTAGTPNCSPDVINTYSSPQPMMDNKSEPTIPSNLDLPLTPPIHQSPDLSRLADLSQADLAVQTPPTSTSTNKQTSSTTSPRPKLKATISSEVRQVVRSRKQTNITAPTAASLAKVRASDAARSSSQPNGSATRSQSTNTSAGALGSNNLPKTATAPRIPKTANSPGRPAAAKPARKDSDPAHLRDVRVTSVGTPKERPRMESIRASTPAPSTAFKKAVIAKTKVPPLPSFGTTPTANPKTTPNSPTPPVKVTRRVISADPQKSTKPIKSEPTANPTGSTIKPDKRPLQRSRVASVATPISGIKKSPSLKSTAAQPSTARVVSSVASPKLTVTGTSGTTRSPDLSTPKAKTRIAPVKTSSSVKKSPKLPGVSFPESSADQAPNKAAKKTAYASHLPTSFKKRTATQSATDTAPNEESKATESATRDPVTSLVEDTNGPEDVPPSSAEETNRADAVDIGQAADEDSEARAAKSEASPESDESATNSADRAADPSLGEHIDPAAEVVHPKPIEDGEEHSVLEELEGLKLAHHQPLEELQKHHLAGPPEEDESSRPDVDASTTTNTDGEE